MGQKVELVKPPGRGPRPWQAILHLPTGKVIRMDTKMVKRAQASGVAVQAYRRVLANIDRQGEKLDGEALAAHFDKIRHLRGMPGEAGVTSSSRPRRNLSNGSTQHSGRPPSRASPASLTLEELMAVMHHVAKVLDMLSHDQAGTLLNEITARYVLAPHRAIADALSGMSPDDALMVLGFFRGRYPVLGSQVPESPLQPSGQNHESKT